MTTLHLGNSISRLPLRRGLLFIPLALCCLALLPTAHSQTCFSNCNNSQGNTALGSDVLFGNTSGTANMGIGYEALATNTTGSANAASGYHALLNNTSGAGNTANGAGALTNNTTASNNTATGASALGSNTTGGENTANGEKALFTNTTGDNNTANGGGALLSNTTGNNNTANGVNALYSNTTGNNNTANGFSALNQNTTGTYNTANGFRALANNTTGGSNTANGDAALNGNTTGNSNTANGVNALYSNTTGSDNMANGLDALFSNTTGSSNIALGHLAGYYLTTGSNNIDIGNFGVAGDANKIRIGHVGTQNGAFIAGIHGAIVASGVGVIVGSNGQLGTVVSSERFKDDIKPMDRASEAILALKPVTFHYKHELDPGAIPQFGLVAEQVEKVNPALVARDADGKVFTVRYEAVNAMLLNEFLKEHRTVQELKSAVAKQEAIIAQQQKGMEAVTATLKEQASQIQKVSEQLEVSNGAPQIVVSNQ